MPTKMKHFIASLVLFTAVNGIAAREPHRNGIQPRRVSYQGFTGAVQRRDITSWGGYAILTTDSPVPDGSIVCEGSTKSTGRWHCPKGTTCIGEPEENFYPVCCPSSSDCSAIVWSLYACADTSWTLWRVGPSYSRGDRMCCAGDETAIQDNNKIRCLNNSLPIPTTIVLPKIRQITQTAAPAPGQTVPTTSGGGDDDSGEETGKTPPAPGPDNNFDPGPGSGTDSGSDSGSGSPGSSPSTGDSESGSGGDGGGLSQPATIAIAVLSTILGLSAIFIGWLLWERSKKRKLAVSTGLPTQPQQSQPPPMASFVAPPPPGPGPQPIYVSGPAPVPGPYITSSAGPVTDSIPTTTPSPGPSSTFPEPVSGIAPPPAYVPPVGHPHTQELHGQGAPAPTPGHGGATGPITINPFGERQLNEQELDGNARYQAPGSPRGLNTGGGRHHGNFEDECT